MLASSANCLVLFLIHIHVMWGSEGPDMVLLYVLPCIVSFFQWCGVEPSLKRSPPGEAKPVCNNATNTNTTWCISSKLLQFQWRLCENSDRGFDMAGDAEYLTYRRLKVIWRMSWTGSSTFGISPNKFHIEAAADPPGRNQSMKTVLRSCSFNRVSWVS